MGHGRDAEVLITNTYDNLTACPGLTASTPPDPAQAKQFDTTVYGNPNIARGNLTLSVSSADFTCINRDWMSNVIYVKTNKGSAKMLTDAGHAYAVPTQVTANNLTSTLSWNSLLQLEGTTGPNGDTVGTLWDAEDRPGSTTSPYGVTTSMVYGIVSGVTPPVNTSSTPNIGGGSRGTKTTLDGFGRPVRTITFGTNSTGGGAADSYVDREYQPCACSPLGKLKRVSMPYTFGATPVWTTYDYDYLGRTTKITYPPNSGTAGNSGTTTYAYQGTSVK